MLVLSYKVRTVMGDDSPGESQFQSKAFISDFCAVGKFCNLGPSVRRNALGVNLRHDH